MTFRSFASISLERLHTITSTLSIRAEKDKVIERMRRSRSKVRCIPIVGDAYANQEQRADRERIDWRWQDDKEMASANIHVIERSPQARLLIETLRRWKKEWICDYIYDVFASYLPWQHNRCQCTYRHTPFWFPPRVFRIFLFYLYMPSIRHRL